MQPYTATFTHLSILLSKTTSLSKLASLRPKYAFVLISAYAATYQAHNLVLGKNLSLKLFLEYRNQQLNKSSPLVTTGNYIPVI